MVKNKFFDDLIEDKLLGLHTAFLAKVIDFDEEMRTATIQPLSMVKQIGAEPKKQAVIGDVIYLSEVRPLRKESALDRIVLCVCCERDISRTKQGEIALPSLGRHQMKDCVIIGNI